MPSAAIDPPTTRRVEDLLALEHQLDVANGFHPARPNAWTRQDPPTDPAPRSAG